jgi:hypothetical protein
VHARLGIAVVGKELAADEIVEQRGDLAGVVGVRRELASELGAGVFCRARSADRALTQREGLLRSRSAAAGERMHEATPAFSRIFASISAASSGCSFRYSRALSLPWPMRSFLYAYQAPDLSTMPCCTPSSRISPSREMPSP